MIWHQATLRLPSYDRGFHLITSDICAAVPEISQFTRGLLHVFIQHTSASLSINENADADVPRDLEMAFNTIAPEDLPYVHTMEGADDMPAHVKSSLLGSSLTIPIHEGRLALGTWQGIYLWEHRRRPHNRTVTIHVTGLPTSPDGGR